MIQEEYRAYLNEKTNMKLKKDLYGLKEIIFNQYAS